MYFARFEPEHTTRKDLTQLLIDYLSFLKIRFYKLIIIS